MIRFRFICTISLEFLFDLYILLHSRFPSIYLPYRMLSVHLSYQHELHHYYHSFRSTNCMLISFRAMLMEHDIFPRHNLIYLLSYARCYHFDLNVSKLLMYYYYSVSNVVTLFLLFIGRKNKRKKSK